MSIVAESVSSELRRLAEQAALEEPENTEEAAKLLQRRIRARRSRADAYSDFLIKYAIKGLIHDARCSLNKSLKKSGEDGTVTKANPGKPKVITGRSSAVRRAHRNMYMYFIGGRALGWLFGFELEHLAEMEIHRAEGHQANARLLLRLKDLVPPNATVSSKVSKRKLSKLAEEVGIG